MAEKIKNNSWKLITILGVLYTAAFYPGLMSSDSETIYSQALLHQYSDHHPPLMALLWHYLDILYKGPFLMLVINMLMFWGTMLLGNKIFKDSYFKYWFLIMPFFPQIIIYSGYIWKDVIFTFGYGLIFMFLSYRFLKQKGISNKEFVLILLFLFYFTSVKFQARFALPVMLTWLFYIKFNKMLPLQAIVFSVLSIFAINQINSFIVNQHQGSNNSWQYVKIYDLAGMSIQKNKMLLPKFLLKNDTVTVEDVKKNFELTFEKLIFQESSPLVNTSSDKEREDLLEIWREMVIKYPFAYLKHRFNIWSEGMLFQAAGSQYIENKFSNNKFIINFVLPIFKMTAFIFYVPFLIYFMYISLKKYEVNPFSKPLLFINLMALSYLMAFFVFSLSASPRFTYFTYFHFLLSVPFGFACLKKVEE